MLVNIRSIHEDKPGEKWQKQFDKAWPYYKKWFLSEGFRARPTYLDSYEALEKHMPELFPLYEELCELAGGGDVEARFLAQYCPPAYMSGCSQIAWTKDATKLIRNYDYSPKLFEGVLLSTNWLKKVIAISDSLWGALDGMNEDGLAVSLTFGGRKVVGHGFGIPLVLRYVLETCSNVQEGVETLSRLPLHMTYNITLLDKEKNFSTVFLSPDRPIQIHPIAIGTNHQDRIEWEDYARNTETLERMQFLEGCIYNIYETEQSISKKFLQPPLYTSNFEKNYGTLYTSVYDLEKKEIELIWPQKKLKQSFSKFKEGKTSILLNRMNDRLVP